LKLKYFNPYFIWAWLYYGIGCRIRLPVKIVNLAFGGTYAGGHDTALTYLEDYRHVEEFRKYYFGNFGKTVEIPLLIHDWDLLLVAMRDKGIFFHITRQRINGTFGCFIVSEALTNFHENLKELIDKHLREHDGQTHDEKARGSTVPLESFVPDHHEGIRQDRLQRESDTENN